MRKRCQKGKSCGETCIFRGLVCRLDLGYNLSSVLGEVKSGLVRSPQTSKSNASLEKTGNRAKVESLALEVRRKRLKKEDFSKELKELTTFVNSLEGKEKREGLIKANLALGKRLKVEIKHGAESEESARSAGKDFLKGFKSLGKTVEMIDRYDSVFKSIVSKLGGGTSPDKISIIQDKLSKINKKKGKLESDLEKIMEEIRNKLLKTNLSDKQVSDLVSRVWTDKASDMTRSHMEEFIRMFNGRGFTDVAGASYTKAVTSVADIEDRAHAVLTKGALKTRADKSVTFHELAHIVEGQREWMTQHAVNWRDSRAYGMTEIRENVGKNLTASSWYRTWTDSSTSVPLLKLKDLFFGSNFDEGELAIVDKFMSRYMGKVYHNPISPATPQKATEVWSVAFEHFASPQGMAILYKAHPELFEIVVGMATSP